MIIVPTTPGLARFWVRSVLQTIISVVGPVGTLLLWYFLT